MGRYFTCGSNFCEDDKSAKSSKRENYPNAKFSMFTVAKSALYHYKIEVIRKSDE